MFKCNKPQLLSLLITRNLMKVNPSSSSSSVPLNFIEDSGGVECLLVRKVGEYERQRVNLLWG